MQENPWIGLLRRIPAGFHEGMIVATVTGADIVLQTILRLDEDFLILRGRAAGTSDAGKLMIVPYAQINYIYHPGRLTEPQMLGMFGGGDMSFANLPANLPASRPTPTQEPAEPTPLEEMTANGVAEAENAPAPAKPAHHSKSLLLAKLRAKLAGDGPKSPRR